MDTLDDPISLGNLSDRHLEHWQSSGYDVQSLSMWHDMELAIALMGEKLPLTSEGWSEEAYQVHRVLEKNGLEHPYLDSTIQEKPKDEAEGTVAKHIKGILTCLGLDPASEDLRGTPDRVARFYLREAFSGLDYKNFPKLAFSQVDPKQEKWVVTEGIQLTSHCAHHFVIMEGFAKVAYLPHKKILGLSKINRICRFFAARPQLQERLTGQCLMAFQTLLETENVAVEIQASHFCVRSRGVRDQKSLTKTLEWGGRFRTEQSLQQLFMRREG